MAVASAHAQAKHGGDVDDTAAALGASQTLRGALGHAPDAVKIGRQHMAPIEFADLQHPLTAANSGIVKYQINRPEGGLCGVKGRFDTGAIGDIHRHWQRLATVLADNLGQCLQAFHAPCCEHYTSTRATCNTGQVSTNPAGGAGDHQGMAAQGKRRIAQR
ncbi:hypothetical protein D3C77_522650 [compost metagenome]